MIGTFVMKELGSLGTKIFFPLFSHLSCRTSHTIDSTWLQLLVKLLIYKMISTVLIVLEYQYKKPQTHHQEVVILLVSWVNWLGIMKNDDGIR